MANSGNKAAKNFARQLRKREGRAIGRSPSSRLGQYQGIRVGGKKYTRFSQLKSKPARRKTLGEKIMGGVAFAM